MSENPDITQTRTIWQKPIAVASIAGLVPFVLALVLTLFPMPWLVGTLVFERAVIGYGALALGFMGGVRWGIRMQSGTGGDRVYIAAVLGSILGFITLLLPVPVALALLVIGFAAQGLWDVWTGFRGGLPGEYVKLRTYATFAVCALLIAILAARAFANG